MNILGISGFENSMPFKRAHWPSLDEREYRISQGHDAAAALVVDGDVVAAAAEERFNREKHSARFPLRAIEYCLAEAGLALEDVDELAHGFDYQPFRQLFSLDPVASELYREVYSREALLKLAERDLAGFPADRVHHVGHHLAHAASAFFTSGFDECLVVVIDGMGEVVSATVYRGNAGRLEKLHEISAAHSIGILYSLVTLHLGFNFGADEYKIMGLAPYG
ncbi:carbamoyltransferase N-terminal domain-containing protein, partial [Mycobacterium sp.]|uniref:carbamoyltransferase N-terminal domain-containing protein n=1 Tax=Mycobacterium sp. TaxID=1785 RepID=UPI003BB1CA2B